MIPFESFINPLLDAICYSHAIIDKKLRNLVKMYPWLILKLLPGSRSLNTGKSGGKTNKTTFVGETIKTANKQRTC